MTSDLDLITDAAREAGRLAVELRALGLQVSHKAGGSPVTNGDLAVNTLLKSRLHAARPDYGWLSEESPDNPARLEKARVFVIDPIDGTSAYVKGRDWWTVCIAVVEAGWPIAGVVHAPVLEETYAAEIGKGARRNGDVISASQCRAVEGCAMLGDVKMFADARWPTPWPAMTVSQRNSVAYRMALVASGRADACISPSVKHDWDLAAADLIVTEAGGRATDNQGRAFIYNRPVPTQSGLVCSGAGLHPLLVARTAHIDTV